MEIISSDLTDVMSRLEPSQVITQQSQFLTININLALALQKHREREREREESTNNPRFFFLVLLSDIKPQCEQSSHCGKYCFQIIK